MSQTPQEDTLYGSTGRHEEPESPYHLQENQEAGHDGDAESSLGDEYEMSLTELLYSSSSYHAIVKPGKRVISFLLLKMLKSSCKTLTHSYTHKPLSIVFLSYVYSHINHDAFGIVSHFH